MFLSAEPKTNFPENELSKIFSSTHNYDWYDCICASLTASEPISAVSVTRLTDGGYHKTLAVFGRWAGRCDTKRHL